MCRLGYAIANPTYITTTTVFLDYDTRPFLTSSRP